MKTLDVFTISKGKTLFEKVKISRSEDAADYIRRFYFDDLEIYESAFLLLLNRNNVTIGYAKISQGGITGTVIDPKIVAKYIADTLASGVILCHNHPSGSLIPSEPDKNITKKIKDVCLLLDSILMDHLILTSEGFYSFADNGII